MFGSYLGLSKNGGSSSNDPQKKKYGRSQDKASPSTRCGKCNKLGHYTYECTGVREYKVRPTRTQILANPKLRTPLTASLPPRTEEMAVEGTAAGILAANEAKRVAKLKAAADQSSSSSSSSSSSGSSSSGSSSSGSSSSGSDSESDSGDDKRRNRRRRSRSRSRSRSPVRARERRSRSPEERRSKSDGTRVRDEEERGNARSKGKGRAIDEE